MRRNWRAAALALVVIVMVPTLAAAQTGLGVRAGSFPVDGDHIEMDAETAFGAHVALGFIPVLKFQLGAEFLSGTATYDYAGIPAFDEDFQAISVYADVRYPISVVPMFPVKPVVGGGLNLNLMSYLDEDAAGAVGSQDPADFTHTGYHLMVGLMFDPPVLPFTITAEYRMKSIKLEDDTISSNGILLGLTFGF
jgi:hypothetical protein